MGELPSVSPSRQINPGEVDRVFVPNDYYPLAFLWDAGVYYFLAPVLLCESSVVVFTSRKDDDQADNQTSGEILGEVHLSSAFVEARSPRTGSLNARVMGTLFRS